MGQGHFKHYFFSLLWSECPIWDGWTLLSKAEYHWLTLTEMWLHLHPVIEKIVWWTQYNYFCGLRTTASLCIPKAVCIHSLLRKESQLSYSNVTYFLTLLSLKFKMNTLQIKLINHLLDLLVPLPLKCNLQQTQKKRK